MTPAAPPRRVVFTAPRQVTLEDFTLGQPGPGQVLVHTEQTLISTGTELTALTGDFPPGSAWAAYIRYPWVAGYSAAGRIEAVGEGVTQLAPGALVTGSWPHASAAIVSAASLLPLPDGLSAEEGTFAVLGATVLNGVRRARIDLGETVAIVGAGIIGQLCAQYARLQGGYPVVVIDTAAERLATARRLGAHHTLAVRVEDARADVLRLSRNLGVSPQRIQSDGGADAVFEVTGHPAVVAGATRLARREGRVILLGSSRGPSTIDLHDDAHSRGISLIGAHVSTHPPSETPQQPWTRQRNAALFLELAAARALDVHALITHRYPAAHAPDAFAMLLEDRTRALGVILDWTS